MILSPKNIFFTLNHKKYDKNQLLNGGNAFHEVRLFKKLLLFRVILKKKYECLKFMSPFQKYVEM